MFAPRLALASLSGRSDAPWARAGSEHAGAAFLGGITLDESSRAAARDLVARGREEFLPPDPVRFVERQLATLESQPIRPGVNVRATSTAPIPAVATACRHHDALLEINAHCRQPELTEIGCGESLLRDRSRLGEYVACAATTGARTGVKVRAEVPGVSLPAVCQTIEASGGDFVHVDAMDSPSVVADIARATDLFIIANNGVRGPERVDTYQSLGADAVSIGRPSTDPAIRERVHAAVVDMFGPVQASVTGD